MLPKNMKEINQKEVLCAKCETVIKLEMFDNMPYIWYIDGLQFLLCNQCGWKRYLLEAIMR